MAAGLAVVATRIGGAPEVVQDFENGLLVPASDPDSLAEAISRCLDGPDFAAQLGRAARRRIVERYSMEQLVENTSRMYETMLEPGGDLPDQPAVDRVRLQQDERLLHGASPGWGVGRVRDAGMVRRGG